MDELVTPLEYLLIVHGLTEAELNEVDENDAFIMTLLTAVETGEAEGVAATVSEAKRHRADKVRAGLISQLPPRLRDLMIERGGRVPKDDPQFQLWSEAHRIPAPKLGR